MLSHAVVLPETEVGLSVDPMPDSKQPQPTQQTQPKKGEPVEIPVPKREDFDRLVRKAAEKSESASDSGPTGQI